MNGIPQKKDFALRFEDLVAGRLYVLRGEGELLLAEAVKTLGVTPSRDRQYLVFLAHGNSRYHATLEQVYREATPEDVRRRHQNAMERRVECRDRECWCRKYIDEVSGENGNSTDGKAQQG